MARIQERLRTVLAHPSYDVETDGAALGIR